MSEKVTLLAHHAESVRQTAAQTVQEVLDDVQGRLSVGETEEDLSLVLIVRGKDSTSRWTHRASVDTALGLMQFVGHRLVSEYEEREGLR